MKFLENGVRAESRRAGNGGRGGGAGTDHRMSIAQRVPRIRGARRVESGRDAVREREHGPSAAVPHRKKDSSKVESSAD